MIDTVVWPIIQKAVISIGVIVLEFSAIWLLNEVLLKRLVRAAEKTHWHWDEALLKSVRKVLPILSLLLGLYLSTSFWDVRTELETAIGQYIIGAIIILATGFFCIHVNSHICVLWTKL